MIFIFPFQALIIQFVYFPKPFLIWYWKLLLSLQTVNFSIVHIRFMVKCILINTYNSHYRKRVHDIGPFFGIIYFGLLGVNDLKYIESIKNDLSDYTDREKAEFLPRFFNAFPGGYGEGDQFLGVKVPDQHKVAKKYYRDISLGAVEKLLREPFHEYRLTALLILVYKFEKAKLHDDRKAIVDLYIRNLQYVNNWDLVDSSAYKILGAYLFDKDRSILYRLARSDHLWSQRVAIIATLFFIRKNQFSDTLNIAEIL